MEGAYLKALGQSLGLPLVLYPASPVSFLVTPSASPQPKARAERL